MTSIAIWRWILTSVISWLTMVCSLTGSTTTNASAIGYETMYWLIIFFFIMGFPFKRYHGEKKTADFGAQMFDFDSFRLSRAKVSHANQRPMPWGPGASWGCADDVRLRSPPLSVNNQVRIVKWGSIGIIRMIDDIHP